MPAEDDRARRPGPPRRVDGRRARQRLDRARAVRRRRGIAGLALAAALALIAVLAFGGGRSPTPRPAARAATHHTAARDPARTAAASAGEPGLPPDPGTLPQTNAYPSGTSARFRSLMADLWAGVVANSVSRALPAFFPKTAYVQLKAIADAGADWNNRLVHDYGLDLGAAHALLGSGASRARLLAVDVVSRYGHWIAPGVCDNRLGYYEMPNARVVYREAGQVRSFGIASMISWRGVWYVVHLGAILRPTDTGMVDDPLSGGPGTSLYSGTC